MPNLDPSDRIKIYRHGKLFNEITYYDLLKQIENDLKCRATEEKLEIARRNPRFLRQKGVPPTERFRMFKKNNS